MKTYGDGDKNKKVKLLTLRRQLECLTMDENESIADYFDKVQDHVNVMKACRDTITDQHVDKILQTLAQRFDHVVVAIEETKDLEEMELETLQHSLEVREYRISECRHSQEQALQARVVQKGKDGTSKGNKPFNK